MLEKKSLIKPNEDFIRVKFDDFENASRIQFLYSFTNKFCIYLEFKAITDIDLYLDETIESHKDVKMFLDEIDSLKLNGKELQNHVLLRDNKYHDKLIFGSISLKYNFDVTIVFSLSKDSKKITTENKLRKEIFSSIEKNKITNYPKYKRE